MNKYYSLMFRWVDAADLNWSHFKEFGTFSTVVDAIKSIIEEYENPLYLSKTAVKITFENEDLSPAKVGDIFWIQIYKEYSLLSKVQLQFIVTEGTVPFKRLNCYKIQEPTTVTHPKLYTAIANWNVVSLTPLLSVMNHE